MPRIQELCGLRICWLERGQVCFESMLGLNEHAPANVVARHEPACRAVCRVLKREALLAEMLCGNQKFMPRTWSHDRLVEVLTPVTLFEFEALDTKDSRLAPALKEQGARNLFEAHLDDLERIGQALKHSGQAHDRGRWGVCVYFHTLWVFPASFANSLCPPAPQLAGQVDLYRLPLAMFAEKRVEAEVVEADAPAEEPMDNSGGGVYLPRSRDGRSS